MLPVGNIFVISAASGTGKSSLVKAVLAKEPKVKVSISHTTRAARASEQDGREYFFTDKEEFNSLIRQDKFLEWATVHDNLYGTAKKTVHDLINAGHDVILEIDVQGAAQVRNSFPQAKLVFILPPSLQELERRLRGRGEDSEEVIAKRLQNSICELKQIDKFDYVIINDLFEQALIELCTIINAARLTFGYQKVANNEVFTRLNITDKG